MCGIAGSVGDDDRAQTRVRAALMALRHRGPDDSRTSRAGDVVFGTARLAIVDRAKSAQPIGDSSGHLLAFNGEIFNFGQLRHDLQQRGHRFLTDGDTEVLFHALRQWGVDEAVRQLQGQFAFAFVDLERRRMWLARDRTGILPLFYRRTGHQFGFASSVNALDLVTAETSTLSPPAALALFLAWGLPPGQAIRTSTAEVRAAHIVEVDLNTHHASERPYWAPLDATVERGCSTELWAAIDEAVHARIADEVETAVALSGGVDSVGVAAAAATHGTRRAYGVRFATDGYDEGQAQRRAATMLGIDLTTVEVTPADLAENLVRTVRAAETPLLRMAPVGTNMLAEKMAADGVRVALTGEGADELFGGYTILKRAAGVPVDASAELPPDLAHGLSVGVLSTSATPNTTEDAATALLREHRRRWALGRKLSSYLTPDFHDLDGTTAALAEHHHAAMSRSTVTDAFDAARVAEFTTFLPSALLATQSDRQFMNHSIEGRYPYLDENVVDKGFACTARDLIDPATGEDKIPLRRAVAAVAGRSLAARPKLAYTAPIQTALTTSAGAQLCRDYLSAPALTGSMFEVSRIDWLVRALTRRPLSGEEQRILLFALTTQILKRSPE